MVHLLCQWHAAENIRTKITKASYTEARCKGIMDHVWAWLKTERLVSINLFNIAN
jgi:hypothetical protein